jgi:hypothetical protein
MAPVKIGLITVELLIELLVLLLDHDREQAYVAWAYLALQLAPFCCTVAFAKTDMSLPASTVMTGAAHAVVQIILLQIVEPYAVPQMRHVELCPPVTNENVGVRMNGLLIWTFAGPEILVQLTFVQS